MLCSLELLAKSSNKLRLKTNNNKFKCWLFPNMCTSFILFRDALSLSATELVIVEGSMGEVCVAYSKCYPEIRLERQNLKHFRSSSLYLGRD
jgi:hypothetical protein